jgi:hypothetical protein
MDAFNTTLLMFALANTEKFLRNFHVHLAPIEWRINDAPTAVELSELVS